MRALAPNRLSPGQTYERVQLVAPVPQVHCCGWRLLCPNWRAGKLPATPVQNNLSEMPKEP